MTNTCENDVIGNKICWNYNYDVVNKIAVYISIVFLILFIINIVYSIYYCGKFSFNCFGILVLLFAILNCYYTVIFLTSKVESISNNGISSVKVGDHWLKTISEKANAYIIFLGNLLFLLVFISYCFKNKTTYFNCNDFPFPWKVPVIIVVAWVILICKFLINSL